MQPIPIERCRDITPQNFRSRYVQSNKPVVMENIAVHWNERWTPKLLQSTYGDRPIQCETRELFVHDRKKRQLQLRDLVDSVLSSSLDYRVRSFSFLNQVSELKEDFEQNSKFLEMLPNAAKIMHAFWLTPQGNKTVLHHDSFYENLNIQVFGRKRFLLMPPRDTKKMYSHVFSESPIDPTAPDLGRFPRFKGTSMFEAILNPGEVIYIPAFWWHYVVALEPSINITSWTKAEVEDLRRTTSQLPPIPKCLYLALYNERFESFLQKSEKALHRGYALFRNLVATNS
jgi:ribosomal protein L16 Arg81 hydroxylase